MKYTIFGFSQQLMVDQCVNISDAAVLRFIIDFYHTGKMKKMIVGGREYIWVDYKYVSDNLPIIHVGYKSKTDRANKKRVTDCIQSLVNAGVLEKYIQKDTQGTFVYIRIIEEMYNRYIAGVTTTKVTGYHHKGNGATTTEVVLYNDDSSINDSSISIPPGDESFKKASRERIIKYLNAKLGTSYKPNSIKTKSTIEARLNEGFSVEDFKPVIDNQILIWGNDNEMKKFLRPETLFGTKFEGYLQATKIKASPGVSKTKTLTMEEIEELNS